MKETKDEIKYVEVEKLVAFRGHPFQVRDDEEMRMLIDSIRVVGVLTPAIVTPFKNGTYEMISGHRRKRACELLGLKKLPVIVKNVDYDTATIMMVDSNFQREVIRPSERAKAYKMKLDAIKRQGARKDLTSVQLGQKLEKKSSRDLIAENSQDSSSQIQRYLRLNELISGLLNLVDEGRIALTPASEISFLTEQEQEWLLLTIESEQTTPSLSQAQRMKKLSKQGLLSEDEIFNIMTEQKKPESWNLSLPMNRISKFFPSYYTPKRMEETILDLLEEWNKVNDIGLNVDKNAPVPAPTSWIPSFLPRPSVKQQPAPTSA